MTLIALDFEASCLPRHGRSYPIEIGIADEHGLIRSWLIRPPDAWAGWGWTQEAERLHGISKEQLARDGLPPARVVAELEPYVRGARVIATASTANQDLLKQLGADVAVDYTKTRFEDVAKDVDAVLDPVGKETLARSYGVVKKGGIVMSLVARPDPVELQKHGIRSASISVHPDTADLTEIAQLVDAGKIKPVVTEVLPLNDAVKAQQQAATHHTRGKVVLRIADEPKG